MNLQDFARAYVAQCTEEDLEKDAASVKGIIAGAKKVGKKVLTKVKKPAKAVAAKTKAVAKKAGKKVTFLDVKRVKGYSPSADHFVFDLKITKS